MLLMLDISTVLLALCRIDNGGKNEDAGGVSHIKATMRLSAA